MLRPAHLEPHEQEVFADCHRRYEKRRRRRCSRDLMNEYASYCYTNGLTEEAEQRQFASKNAPHLLAGVLEFLLEVVVDLISPLHISEWKTALVIFWDVSSTHRTSCMEVIKSSFLFWTLAWSLEACGNSRTRCADNSHEYGVLGLRPVTIAVNKDMLLHGVREPEGRRGPCPNPHSAGTFLLGVLTAFTEFRA